MKYMYDEIPSPFLTVLARDKRAMQAFARLSPIDKQKVLRRADRIRGSEGIRLLVLSLEDGIDATEYF